VLAPRVHEAELEAAPVGAHGLALRAVGRRRARRGRAPEAVVAGERRRYGIKDPALRRAGVVLCFDAILQVWAEGGEPARAVAAARRAEVRVGGGRALAQRALALKRGQARTTPDLSGVRLHDVLRHDSLVLAHRQHSF